MATQINLYTDIFPDNFEIRPPQKEVQTKSENKEPIEVTRILTTTFEQFLYRAPPSLESQQDQFHLIQADYTTEEIRAIFGFKSINKQKGPKQSNKPKKNHTKGPT
eukprot:16818_1